MMTVLPFHCHRRLVYLVGLISVLLVVVFNDGSKKMVAHAEAAATATVREMTCEADGTCKKEEDEGAKAVPANQQFSITFINDSKFRADVYWDDGRFGSNVLTLDGNGGEGSLNTYRDHSFFVTRHGVKEGLFDPKTDEQYRYKTQRPDETFVIPKSAAPSQNKCQDRFSICRDEAKRTGCWENPGWMIVHCCKSCSEFLDAETLIDSKARCTKEHLNITKPAWERGDLNNLFSSWATEQRFKEYEPVVLSSPKGAHGGKKGPWVITFDNFLTDAEADALIRGAELVGFERSTNQGTMNDLGEMERVVSTTRTSSNAWCTGRCEALPEVQSITRKIEQVTGVPRKNYESFQILEYEPNQFYRKHHDSSGRDKKPSGPRIMTFFLYLSDVEEGGETYFNKLDIAVKPKKGRALVWPSVQDQDPEYWDDRMYHEAKDVIRGKKYAANHWIHLNDYMGPNIWGCTGSFS